MTHTPSTPLNEGALQAAITKAHKLEKVGFTFHDNAAVRAVIEEYRGALPMEASVREATDLYGRSMPDTTKKASTEASTTMGVSGEMALGFDSPSPDHSGEPMQINNCVEFINNESPATPDHKSSLVEKAVADAIYKAHFPSSKGVPANEVYTNWAFWEDSGHLYHSEVMKAIEPYLKHESESKENHLHCRVDKVQSEALPRVDDEMVERVKNTLRPFVTGIGTYLDPHASMSMKESDLIKMTKAAIAAMPRQRVDDEMVEVLRALMLEYKSLRGSEGYRVTESTALRNAEAAIAALTAPNQQPKGE